MLDFYGNFVDGYIKLLNFSNCEGSGMSLAY